MDILSLILSLALITNQTKTQDVQIKEAERKEIVLDYFVDRLALCESSHKEDVKVLDSNNKYSYGVLQFQEATWKYMLRKYGYLSETEDDELMNHIYDAKLQKDLAKKILSDGGWRHWANCSKAIGLDKFK